MKVDGLEVADKKHLPHHSFALATQGTTQGTGALTGSLTLLYGHWAIILVFRSAHSTHTSIFFFYLSKTLGGGYLKHELVIKRKESTQTPTSQLSLQDSGLQAGMGRSLS